MNTRIDFAKALAATKHAESHAAQLDQAIRDSEAFAERQELRAEFAKVILQGLVISGRINWEDPNADLLRCWRLAARAVTARDMA